MTREDRVRLFQQALAQVAQLRTKYPSHPPFESLYNQLVYLLQLASGNVADTSPLAKINVGILAVREVEDRDEATANLLYQVSGEVDRMKAELGMAASS